MKKITTTILFFITVQCLCMAQTQIGANINGGEATYDQFGWRVSISSDGSIVAIGAYTNDGVNGTRTGHARVYQYNNTSSTWIQIGADIDGEAAEDWSGYSVSLSSDGTIVAIGAYQNDGINGTNSGHVRVYEYNSTLTTWTQIGADIDGEAAGDNSGFNTSLSNDGTIVAIGANRNDNSKGHVRVYKNISGTWTQLGADIDGEATGDSSGFNTSLSSDGSIIAIGAYLNDGVNGSDSGHVRVYKYDNTTSNWTQLGADIDGEASGDRFGNSVSLSDDGNTLAIGAPFNNGTASSAGHVQIYRNVSGTWTQLGVDIDGEAAGDNCGNSVSLSSDGNTVAIGAFKNKGGGTYYYGNTRVFDLSGLTLSSDSFVLNNFSIYPNPSSELVTISLTQNLELEQVNIYNTLGQLVKTENNTIIPVNNLSKGSYFFEVITNKGKATKMILVQ